MTTTTVIEKSGSLTIYKADVEYEIPPIDLLTLLFGMLRSNSYIIFHDRSFS